MPAPSDKYEVLRREKTPVEGMVISTHRNKATIDLLDGTDAIVPINDVSSKKTVYYIDEHLKVGERITALVKRVDFHEVVLSIRMYEELLKDGDSGHSVTRSKPKAVVHTEIAPNRYLVNAEISRVIDGKVFLELGLEQPVEVDAEVFQGEDLVQGSHAYVVVPIVGDQVGEVMTPSQHKLSRLHERMRKAFNSEGLIAGMISKNPDGGYEADLDGKTFILSDDDDSWPTEIMNILSSQQQQSGLFAVLDCPGEVSRTRLALRALCPADTKAGDIVLGKNAKGASRCIESEAGDFFMVALETGMVHFVDQPDDDVIMAPRNNQEASVSLYLIDREHEIYHREIQYILTPFLFFIQTNPLKTVVNGAVKKINELGAYIEIADGVEGWLPLRRMGRVFAGLRPDHYVQVGEKVEVRIEEILEQEQMLEVGLSRDPWEGLYGADDKLYGAPCRSIKFAILAAGRVKSITPNYRVVVKTSWASVAIPLAEFMYDVDPGDEVGLVAYKDTNGDVAFSHILFLQEMARQKFDRAVSSGEMLLGEVVDRDDDGYIILISGQETTVGFEQLGEPSPIEGTDSLMGSVGAFKIKEHDGHIPDPKVEVMLLETKDGVEGRGIAWQGVRSGILDGKVDEDSPMVKISMATGQVLLVNAAKTEFAVLSNEGQGRSLNLICECTSEELGLYKYEVELDDLPTRVDLPQLPIKVSSPETVTPEPADEPEESVPSMLAETVDEAWGLIEKAHRDKTTVIGTITAVEHKGYSVDIQGVDCFLPLSRAEFFVREKPSDRLVGVTGEFMVMMFSKDKPVLDRQTVRKEKIFRPLPEDPGFEVGDVFDGKVVELAGYPLNVAFIDLGIGYYGRLGLQEVSWRWHGDIRHALRLRQDLQVVVKGFSRDENITELGAKELTVNPWVAFGKKHAPGSVIAGKVAKIREFGVFVEVEYGLQGLVRTSEVDWFHREVDLHEYVQRGDDIEVMVLACNKNKQQLELSIMRCEPNPWENFAEQHPPGSEIAGEVIECAPRVGVKVKLLDGPPGMINKPGAFTSKEQRKMYDELKVGDEIKVFIKDVHIESQEVELSLSRPQTVPIEKYTAMRDNQEPVDGKLVWIGMKLAKVMLDDGVQAILPKDEITDETLPAIEGHYKKGDAVRALVTRVENNVVFLSVKALSAFLSREQAAELQSPADDERHSRGATIAEPDARATAMSNLKRACESKSLILGTMIERAEHGHVVDVGGLRTFLDDCDAGLPQNALDNVPLLGRWGLFQVITIDPATSSANLKLQLIDNNYPPAEPISATTTVTGEIAVEGLATESATLFELDTNQLLIDWHTDEGMPGLSVVKAAGGMVQFVIKPVEPSGQVFQIQAQYPLGTVIEAAPSEVTNTMAYFELARGVGGVLHKNEVGDTSTSSPATAFLLPGVKVKMEVINYDFAQRQVNLRLIRNQTEPAEDDQVTTMETPG